MIVGYEGTQRETDWQTVTLLNELSPLRPLGQHVVRNADAGPLWSALTEFAVPSEELLFEARLLPSSVEAFESLASTEFEIVARAGNGQVFGRVRGPTGHDPGLEDKASRLAAFAAESGGTFRLLHGGAGGRDFVRQSGLPEGAYALMSRLKATFDPGNLLNPLSDASLRLS